LATQIALDEAQLADDRVDAAVNDAEERVRKAETTMNKRLQDTALLEHRAKSAETALSELQASVVRKDADFSLLKEQRHTLDMKHATVKQSLEGVSHQLTALRTEHGSLQRRFANAIEAEKQLRLTSLSDIESIKSELGKSQQTAANLVEQNSNLKASIVERDQTIGQLRSQQHKLELRLEKTEQSSGNALSQLKGFEQDNLKLKEQLAQLTATLHAERATSEADRKNSQLLLNDKSNVIRQLDKTLNALTDSKAFISNE